MNQSAQPPEDDSPAAAVPGGAHASAPPAPRRHAAPREAIFDGGDELIDDGIMRANWAVPWSDLMMTMFVLFAALLAVQTLHERVENAARQQAQHKEIELREQAPR